MGWASGFQAGSQVAQRALDAYEKSQKRYAYDQALKGVGVQDINAPLATEQQAAAANAETQALAAQDAQEFGLGAPEQYTQRQAGEATAPTRYSLAGQTYDQRPSQDMVGLARTEALAQATERFDPLEAQRLRATALQMKGQIAEQAYNEQYRPLQLQKVRTGLTSDQLSIDAAQRTQQLSKTYDTGMEKIMSTTYEKPEDRTTAVLSLIEQTKGPEVAAQLRASYTTNELNNLSLQAKRFDEGFRQARSKGVGQALDWFDEQNTSFKLERDKDNSFKVYQINDDGTRSVFADAKSERELGMVIDAKAKPGGWLELAKFENDKSTADVQQSYYKALTKNVGITDIEKKVAAYTKSLGRKPTTSELNRLFGVEAKETGKMSDLQKANLEHYRKMTERGGPWSGRPQGELDQEAADLGIYELLKPGSKTASGLGGWDEKPTGTDTAPPPKPQPQPILTPPAAKSGLVSPEQYSAGSQQQATQAEARAQGALVRGVEASGRGREDYMLRQEAASLTPAVIQQLTPRQAGEVARKYGPFLTSAQRQALNRQQ